MDIKSKHQSTNNSPEKKDLGDGPKVDLEAKTVSNYSTANIKEKDIFHEQAGEGHVTKKVGTDKLSIPKSGSEYGPSKSKSLLAHDKNLNSISSSTRGPQSIPIGIDIESYIPTTNTPGSSSGEDVHLPLPGTPKPFDPKICINIHKSYKQSLLDYVNNVDIPIDHDKILRSSNLANGAKRAAREIINSISHPSSAGTWQMGKYVSDLIEQKLTNPPVLESPLYIETFATLPYMMPLRKIQAEIQFMQKVRSAAITGAAYRARGDLDQKAYEAFKDNLSLSILSKLRQDDNVLIPVDFIPREKKKNDTKKKNEVLPTSHASLAYLKFDRHVSNINVTFFETTGRFASLFADADDVRPKLSLHPAVLDNHESTSFEELKKLNKLRKKELPRNPASKRINKSFSKIVLKKSLEFYSSMNLPTQDGTSLIKEISSWLSVPVRPDTQGFEEDIKAFTSNLHLDVSEDQRMHAIQEYGVCELKSIYAYLLHEHYGPCFEIIRTAVITDAYRKILHLIDTGDNSSEAELRKVLIGLTDPQSSTEEDKMLSNESSKKLKDLLIVANLKRLQAELRLKSQIKPSV